MKKSSLLLYSFSGGFTLIEMLVTSVVLGVLATIGAPSLVSLIDAIRLRSASSAFFSHLHLARSEAIKRNSPVVLCKSADGVACASSGGWEQGWLVFHDVSANAALDSGEAVIARSQPLPERLRFTGNLNVTRYVSFMPSGATQLVGGAFQAGTFTICWESSSSGPADKIIINAVGRPRMQSIQISSCI